MKTECKKKAEDSEFLTRKEVAAKLRVSYRTVLRYQRSGALVGGRVGGRYHYHKAALERLMAGKLGM